ncbi:MAG TPA: alpha/beta hydrolase-fold protein, partial [Usitatibacteraceae bacterium]|nr:alpha/beta hydrolase-fold protein [Usitatibacteraceae bacterium]
KAFSRYLGDDSATWESYDATALARSSAFAGPVLIDQGESDKFLAEQLQPERFVAACKGTTIAPQLRRHAGYDHSYWFIASFIADHLRYHARALDARGPLADDSLNGAGSRR